VLAARIVDDDTWVWTQSGGLASGKLPYNRSVDGVFRWKEGQ